MNPQEQDTPSPQPKMAKDRRRGFVLLSLLLILTVLFGFLLLRSCKPSQIPTPTIEMLTPGPSPSPTVQDSGFPVADDGSPLPPQVVEQYPPSGGELPISGGIQLIFNQPMDESSTRNAFQMIGPDGEVLQGSMNWPNARTLTFKPERQLQLASDYLVTINASAMTAQGVRLVEPIYLQFTTVGVLEVSQTFPLDGTSEVTSDTVITAIFNRPVVPLVIAEQRDQLPNPFEIYPSVDGKVEWVNTSVVAFRPDQSLDSGTTYTVNISAGLYDAAQETQLTQDYTWSFETITPGISYLELSSGERYPETDATNVVIDEAFTIHFLQPMSGVEHGDCIITHVNDRRSGALHHRMG